MKPLSHYKLLIATLLLVLYAGTLVAGRNSTPEWQHDGDGYRAGGKWKPLGRAANEWLAHTNDLHRLCRNNELTPLAPEKNLVHGSLRLLQSTTPTTTTHQHGITARPLSLATLRAQKTTATVNPVFINPRNGLRLLHSGRLIVALDDPATLTSLPIDPSQARLLRGTTNQYLISCPDLTAEELLALSSTLDAHPGVVWAEPDFIKEHQRHRSLNDPLLPDQWHLHNYGYLLNGLPYSPAGVDINAPDAWDREMGDTNIVVAVIDDGIEVGHPDLLKNIFFNSAEIPGNHTDDDNNGYIDDTYGWDFTDNTNTPEPKTSGDKHGVAVAGLIAARGDNNIGVTGVAPRCRLLPIKIFAGDNFAGASALAEAIRYAAGLTTPMPWRGADIINMSFGGGAPTLAEDSAITDAATHGRNGKGTVIVGSSGNSASDYYYYTKAIPPGTNYFEWRYIKDAAISLGDDTCRLGFVIFPDFTVERFDQPTPPPDWDFKPDANRPGWIIEDNPAKSFGLGRYQARPQITQNNTYAICRSRPVVSTATNSITFFYWISSEANYDFIEFRSYPAGTTPPSFTSIDRGVYATDPYVSYPASHSNVIAVGATTEFDYRSYFSQYGTDLDIVAPGAGGLVGITTTDRSGSAGYNTSGAYTSDFNGTSASAPIVSGAAALLLSRHPDLSATQVRDLLCATADKVGDVTYTDGYNDYYGYGRLNIGRLLWLARVNTTVAFGGTHATANDLPILFTPPATAVQLTATAADYFDFNSWDATPATNAAIHQPTQPLTTATIYDDTTITATFTPQTAPLGTPLYWLATHDLTQPDFTTAELSDTDHDGHAAWQEWQAGTNPHDPSSILRITSFKHHPDTTTTISWHSVSNRLYDILLTPTLNHPTPTIIATNLPATPPLNTYTTPPLTTPAGFITIRTRP